MKVILGEDVLVDNNTAAAFNREQFVKNNILVINLMSSPGAGKTTLLQKTVACLSNEFRIGVIEGDLATEIDANRIREAGAQAVQINTGGGCHLDARMIAKTLPQFDLEHFDILFIENVGNLVCPSGYDLGQNHKIAILSVPEGNDKIPKYPVMFRRTEMVILNKIDLLPYLDFSVEQAIEDLKGINPDSSLMIVSARTDEGMDQWINWIRSAYQQCQRQS
ncbi:hydrogenase nickel incorporation protein HypB [Schinkia azotoformans]|uniref:Hydrogenase accessory protein HypB n=1 Tax=Schinkia azotoformans LMG 9581 TaxID=1131731 RepID=K6CB16_SCHAZ|nr:hydrogenase nickel incorporation protein HypB [Schinkia azotoformans]EKN68335.1 hydrogenase accessory protein HypB [Schinkia azotoformans LMG 9581]MEC1638551.1 hydrogenase nickel incorporation protein HypB [Schinkia azotoformans]MEC1722755.1 hydrogenase nickel incorporation protein HypB [Schinkia azotoformans]MEC1946014.1 hydrogenase nickel incorporation protein HypB [Schinkia azotoformans]MED4351517.1 hydrogenase nickel incorporation protein HypB [Schinkia azotoformans]